MSHQSRKWIGRLTLAATGLVVIVLLWTLLPVEKWLGFAVWHMFDLRGWGILIYFLLCVVLVDLSFPATPLNIGAGILFPFWIGAGVAVAAGLAAAIIGFLLVRYVAGEWIRSRLDKLPRYAELMRLMENAGFQVVFLVRLNPFIPASFQNYGFSLAGVPLRTYMLGTALGQTPVTLAHVYLGWAGGLAIMTGQNELDGWDYLFIGLGALLSVALLLFVSWYGRRRTLGAAGRRSADGRHGRRS